MDIDLGCGQAYAIERIHGLHHVGDQTADIFINLLHWLGDRMQARVGVLQYG
jgi:hypothetical protein